MGLAWCEGTVRRRVRHKASDRSFIFIVLSSPSLFGFGDSSRKAVMRRNRPSVSRGWEKNKRWRATIARTEVP